MTGPALSDVLLDTNVLSPLFDRRPRSLPLTLVDRELVVPFVVLAELAVGLSALGSGRRELADRVLDGLTVAYADGATVQRWVDVTVWSREHGHPIHQARHSNDRWIVAVALAYELPLASSDRIFDGLPGLSHFEM